MSEAQMNNVIWNALIDLFDATNNNLNGSKNKKCNTNLTSFKIHFKYQPWHKILDNKKLNMTDNDPLRIIDALYKNQQYLYKQIKALENILKDEWNISKDIIMIMNSYVFNQTILRLKVSGLAHDIKKKNSDCFNWFHELMFNHVPINNKKDDNDNDEPQKEILESNKTAILSKEKLLYGLDWNILRSHVVKRQLLFR